MQQLQTKQLIFVILYQSLIWNKKYSTKKKKKLNSFFIVLPTLKIVKKNCIQRYKLSWQINVAKLKWKNFFLLVVFTNKGIWAANLPLQENDVHQRSERKMSDKNIDAVKLYLINQAWNLGSSYC
jgi:hypothetical protein